MKSSFTLLGVRSAQVVGGARQKGRLVVDADGSLKGFSTESRIDAGWINGGIYIVEKIAVESWPGGSFDLESKVLTDVEAHPSIVYPSEGKLLDIGIPECYSCADRNLGPVELLFSRLEQLKLPHHG